MQILNFIKIRRTAAVWAACTVLSLSSPAQAFLPPISNAQMYTLASMGNVRALRAAVQRGLNIDTLDRNGNTALCHAIKQRNYTAYNTLRAAGANPNHPCIQNVIQRNYSSFMQSRRVVPTTANSREAYAYLGEEDYFLSPRAWLIGGAILLGGALVLILGGGGGGGGSGGFFPFPSYPTTDYSLGGIAGTSRPSNPESSVYNPVILLEQFGGTLTNGAFPDYNFGDGNPDGWVISNNSSINVDGTSTPLTDLIDFRYSALNYSNYIQVAMKGVNKSTVNNGYSPDSSRYDPNKNYVITLKDNTAALVALRNSTANNYDTIKIDAKNGTLGMIASQSSTAINHTNGLINMSFKGDKDNHSVTGMYADTGSAIINNGTISGTAKSADSTAGFMVGMRGQIINQENPPFSTTSVSNAGSINLNASADNREIRTGLVGMGSYLEQSFLDGTTLLSRAGSVTLNNTGKIMLGVSLTGDNGNYAATDSDGNNLFLKGLGGIIGMRADANTTATNDGYIEISITDTGDESKTVNGSHAGMFSIRNGILVNNKSIVIDGGIGGYGMIAVRGDGKNPELDLKDPTMTNNGVIEINSKDGFGIASFNGGVTTNNGSIELKKQGTGIQHDTGLIENNGSVNLRDGGTGLKMTQEGTINTGDKSSIYIDNTFANSTTSSGSGTTGDGSDGGTGSDTGTTTDGSDLKESIGIYQENGTVNNNGLITIENTKNAAGTVAYGIKANKGTVNNNSSIQISNNDSSYGISISQGNVANNGNISLVNNKGALDTLGYGIKSTQGNVTNSGNITITNKDSAYAIEALAGTVTNTGIITINSQNSLTTKLAYGIKGGNTYITNDNTITINNADESYAISTENGDITNNAVLTLGNDTGALDAKGYGIKSTKGNVTNNAAINVSNKNEAYAIEALAGNIVNNGILTINGNTGAVSNIAYGIKGGIGSITNNKNITINNANEEYGISTENGVVTNNADITLNNDQQTQTKTSYGIKAEKGSVVNNGNIYVNTTGDVSQGIDQDTGSFGIWGNEANVLNSKNAKIIFTKRGNGMHSASGLNQNYGFIHMQKGGVGMSTASGNAINRDTGIITIDDTGIGMKSGLGKATNEGQINITGSMSTGMESENYAENNGTINITGYNSIGMSVVKENAQIVNNKDIIMSSEHNGKLNYGMYGANGIYSRMTNNGNISITGRQYPTTENIAYGMHLDEGEAKNYGTITLKDMFGYGMNLGTGGTLDNYGQILLNYGGIGMGANGTGASEKETAATINHRNGEIRINGDNSYGMKMLGTATAWNDGIIEVDGEDSYGIYTTDGSGTNNSRITMYGDNSVGMHSENADIINKDLGDPAVINIKGQNSVGMQTKDGGTSDTSLIGALNEGTINLESTSNGSTGMKVTGSGKARNKGTINVMSSGSSGMLADGAGTIDNSGTIDVTGSGSYGMKATQGTATNNKEIIIDSDDSIGMYADGGKIVNGLNGTIVITDDNNSKYAMYVLSGEAENNGTLSFTKEGIIAMYARSGTAINNKIINLSGKNSIAMQGEGDAQLTNNKDITISGDSSVGMQAGGNSTTTNEIDGVITVNGPNSKGMVALGVTLGTETTKGTAINSGTIIVNDASSWAMYADGGIIKNTSTGKIITNGSIGMNVNSGSGVNSGIIENDNGNFIAMQVNSGSIENEGRITLDGDNSVGMKITGSGTASNSLKTSVINVNGANSIGMQAVSGTATNYGTINANNATAVAMQADGGTIINEDGAVLQSIGEVAMQVNQGTGINNGEIQLAKDGIYAMRVNQGTITNNKKITLTGNNAVGMATVGTGTATNESGANISISGTGGIGMKADGAGTATNNGTLDINNAKAYAMYADGGGTIINTSGGVINTIGESAMYVKNGVAENRGDISNKNNGFKAIHVVQGSGTNTGTITLNGSDAAAMYANNGTLKNDGGTIVMNGDSNTFGIRGENGTVNVVNSGTITVSASGSAGTGIGIDSGNVTNTGSISVTSASGIGISTAAGSATNEGTVEVTGNAAVGMVTTGGGALTNATGATLAVHGTGAIGMHARQGGQISNNGALTVEGDNAVGMLAENGATAVNGGNLTITGNKTTGMEARSGSLATNTGTIYIKGSEIVGMRATGSGSRIDNQGTIIFSGSTAGNTGQDNIFALANGGSILNQGTVMSDTATTTMAFSRGVNLGANGRFIAAEMDGEMSIDGSALTTGSNQNEYVIKNALTTGNLNNLKVYGTAWFNDVDVVKSDDDVVLPDIPLEEDGDDANNGNSAAQLPADSDAEDSASEGDDNSNGEGLGNTTGGLNPDDLNNYDVVARKGRLQSILSADAGIQDRSVLDKIDNAYEAGRDSQIFDSLKYAQTDEALAAAIKGELGLDLFANFTKQNFDVIKSADRQINATLANNTDDKELRIMAGYDFFGRKQDATAYMSDYDDQAHSAFGLIDKKYNNNFRYGLGAMVTKYESDYKDDTASRDEVMIHLLAPLSMQFGKTKIISVPRIGMGFGDYSRRTDSGTYEADTRNYYYGITNEAQHTFDMGWFGLQPTLEFNVLGMYQDKIKEKRSALEIEATNNISIETGIGLYAVKEIELGEKGKINLRAGGTYYHELGDPFKAQKARLNDAGIRYRVNAYDADRDRAVLSLRMDYRYQQFNLYGEFSKFIEKDDGYAINAGLGYKF